jgi:16S rRNA (cytidine1402-2'-O)-methyltransferase
VAARLGIVPPLSVVPTPIGNLEDITLRALRALREADLVLAEDTRRARTLLSRHGISARVWSYHEHNATRRLPAVLNRLRTEKIALISDAGMPGISDPGYELIRAAIDEGIEVDVLPGPNAAITAVVAAALPAPGFVFLGFLGRTSAERRRHLEAVRTLELPLVLYEAPHRLAATLRDARDLLGDRPAVVARELTKLHQEIRRGTLSEILTHAEGEAPRGEHTVVIAGFSGDEPVQDVAARDELLRRRRAGEERRAAMREVGREYGVARNVLYRWWEEGA